ncbi:tetratricopeptide repeat protein [Kinneretia aquatilis]|uniref:tetratricopeptide repeat protein n=1 Tax=Kinneretia aquatilis TaxID=2070761 RepID=UPI001495365D|nr:tetratricopeptide repeat protein [Paucibacter aquatile]WIV99337.1 tetratricopeptide repeat protein [Paucibacter aquatile]
MHTTTQASKKAGKQGQIESQAALAPAPQVQAQPTEMGTEAALLLAQARNAAFVEAAHGRLGLGMSMLKQALEQTPMSHDLMSDLAALLLSAGELAQAATYAKRALELHPHHGPSLYTLGFACSGLGKTLQAQKTLRHLLRLEPLAMDSLLDEAPDLLPVAEAELARLNSLLGLGD